MKPLNFCLVLIATNIIAVCGESSTGIAPSSEVANVLRAEDDTIPSYPGDHPVQKRPFVVTQILSPGRVLARDPSGTTIYLLTGVTKSLVDDDTWSGWVFEGEHFQYTSIQGTVRTVRTYIAATNNPPMAKNATVTAARSGDAAAQRALGSLYMNGDGVRQDYEESLKWFRLSAEQGDADSENDLGYIYYSGRGVPANVSAAFAWYQKAAAQGLAAAQCNLGIMCEGGIGTPQDYVQAAEWFRKAATQGSALGQYCLGRLYESGLGPQKDYVKADNLYRAAAAQKQKDAIAAIGDLPRSINADLFNNIQRIRQSIKNATNFQYGLVHTKKEESEPRYTEITRLGKNPGGWTVIICQNIAATETECAVAQTVAKEAGEIGITINENTLTFVRDASILCAAATQKLNSVYGEELVLKMKKGEQPDPLANMGTPQVEVPQSPELQQAFDQYNATLQEVGGL